MSHKDDFINAIGSPDKGFESSVKQALDAVLLDEHRSTERHIRPARYILSGALITVAACAVLFFGSKGELPDMIAGQQGALSQPVSSTAEPAGETASAAVADESMEVTAAAESEEYPEATDEEIHETAGQSTEHELTERPANTPEPTPTPIAAAALQPTPPPAEAEAEETERPANALQPTPPPIAAGDMPEEHWMLTDTLGIGINQLYPGYTYSDTAVDQSGSKYWMVSNGEQKVLACAIAYGEIINADIGTGEFKAPTLYVYMLELSDEPERIGTVMAASAPWLAELFESSSAIANSHDRSLPLNTLKITFGGNNEPQVCEMYFGMECEIYISWVREEDTGRFRIIKAYSIPDNTPLDYDGQEDAAGEEAAAASDEVVFADPVLEAAVRGELNLTGALTPEKLAGLTGLQLTGTPIESLDGLQYCTGLEWLELYGCGIDDEDLKYISALPSLFTLNLGSNGITDISPLEGLDLGWLYLSGNRITSLWPISGMTDLYELYLDENDLSSAGALKPLSGLTGMRRLYLNSCRITDAAPIAELAANAPGLEAVYLYGNPIEDYEPIKDLDIRELYWGD